MASAGGLRAAAVLALLCNAFVWGVSWWPFRELGAMGLHPLWSTALIYTLSLSVVLVARRGALAPFRREPLLWLLGIACGLTNVGFNWGVTMGDVVRIVLLFYLMPAWSVLLAWPLLGEKPTAASVARLILALAGVAIVLQDASSGWPIPQGAPDWLALVGGFSFALTNVLLRKMRDVPAPSRVVAMFGGGAALAALTGLVGHASGVVPGLPAPGIGWITLALGLGIAFLFSNLCLQYGASRLAAHTTALVMLSEVVFASVSSVLLGAAELNARIGVGALFILAAAAWSAWPGKPLPAGAESRA